MGIYVVLPLGPARGRITFGPQSTTPASQAGDMELCAQEMRNTEQTKAADLSAEAKKMTTVSFPNRRRNPIFRRNLRGRSPPFGAQVSLQIVKRKDRCEWRRYLVLKFNDPYGADRVLIALQGCRSAR